MEGESLVKLTSVWYQASRMAWLYHMFDPLRGYRNIYISGLAFQTEGERRIHLPRLTANAVREQTSSCQFDSYLFSEKFCSLRRLNPQSSSPPWLHRGITGKLWNTQMNFLGHSLKDSHLICLGCNLGVPVFQSFLDNTNVQAELSSSALKPQL